ncbi:MAG TPA: hypothetical protein PLR80_00615 [Saccharofermentans sp.]|nr:hypothetical protein [Saccharofermentans sp.]
MRRNSAILIVLCMSLLLFGCSFRKDAEITTTIEETSSEAVVSTTTTPHPTREITVTPTPMPTPTSTPTPTPTPTPSEEDVVLSLPNAEGLEVADDSSASFELYLDQVLYPTFGRLTENWEKDIEIDDNCPERDYFEDILGVFGYSINDFDKNGTNEMMVFGFVKSASITYSFASYKYTPYVVLCSYVEGQISVTDVLFIAPEDPENYGYGRCDIYSTAWDSYELVFQTIDNGDNISVAGWCNRIGGFIGNGAYSYCFEYSVENNSIVTLTEVRQIGGGSDGFIYSITGNREGTLVEGIDDTNTSPSEMTENFGVFAEDADICICFEADRTGDVGHVSFTVILR